MFYSIEKACPLHNQGESRYDALSRHIWLHIEAVIRLELCAEILQNTAYLASGTQSYGFRSIKLSVVPVHFG